jgi:hypothetical protein
MYSSLREKLNIFQEANHLVFWWSTYHTYYTFIYDQKNLHPHPAQLKKNEKLMY